MEKIISCCGMLCSECKYYPGDCPGCPKLAGKPFWLQYVEDEVCSIYDCCINKRQYEHCGKCKSLPCKKYFEGEDPTMSKEEIEEIDKKRLELLKSL